MGVGVPLLPRSAVTRILDSPHANTRELKVSSHRWRTALLSVLLVASAAELLLRGPVRLLDGGVTWNDFLSPYIQAKAWVHGHDPYSAQSLVSFWPGDNPRPVWVDSEAADGTLEKKRGIPSPYPLPSLVLMSPLTALPWTAAVYVWSILNTAAIVLSAFGLLSICGCRMGELRSQLFLIGAFALAPIHTGLATGNPAILAASLTVVAHWANVRNREKLTGTLLAVAICLKPTVAGGLLLYYLARRKWKIAAVTIAVAVMITGLGAAPLLLAGIPWISSYLENTRRIFSAGSVDDFTRAARLRFDMINVQILLGGLFRNAGLVNLLSRILGFSGLLCWMLGCYRRRTTSGMLEISTIFVLSLVLVYHRFYDAALLIWPLAWSLLIVRSRAAATLTIVAIVPFFLHGQVLLADEVGKFPPGITNSWWWNNIALPHEAWALIFLTALLLFCMVRGTVEAKDGVGEM